MIAYILLSTLLLNPGPSDSLNLKQCYELARKNHPAYEQLRLNRESNRIQQALVTAKDYPQLSVNGTASYQNEVTTVPGAPFTISKDQYRLSLQLDQNIFDGGAISAAHKINSAREKMDRQQVNVQLYDVKNDVNRSYFGVLLARTNEHILNLKKQVLAKRFETIQSQVKHGMMLPGTSAAIQAEYLATEQQISSVVADEKSALATLSEITGIPMDTATVLGIPVDTTRFMDGGKIKRPELDLFEANKMLLNREMDQTRVSDRPHVSAFVTGMYGRPGLNIFKNSFEPNYIFGIRLRWNLWDWHASRRQRSLLAIQQKVIDTRQRAFLRGVHIGMQQDMADIVKYKSMMNKDSRIIKLREQVERESYSQLRNGTITPSAYLEDLNQVYQAQLSREQHRLQWIYAIVQYMTQTGTL